MTRIGPLVTGHDVEEAVEALLRRWSPAYIGEMSARRGYDRDAMPAFRSYVRTWGTYTRFLEDQLPACVILSTGTVGSPARRGDSWEATWAVGVGAMVVGRDDDSTAELTKLYVAAVRAAVLQHPGLEGFASGSTWVDERYDELPADDRRTAGFGSVSFRVTVTDVVRSELGLLTNDDLARVDVPWPDAEKVLVDVGENAT